MQTPYYANGAIEKRLESNQGGHDDLVSDTYVIPADPVELVGSFAVPSATAELALPSQLMSTKKNIRERCYSKIR